MSTKENVIANLAMQIDELNTALAVFELKARLAASVIEQVNRAQRRTFREKTDFMSNSVQQCQSIGESEWEDLLIGSERVRDVFQQNFHHLKFE